MSAPSCRRRGAGMCWALLLVLWSQAAGEDVSSSFLSERGAWEEGGVITSVTPGAVMWYGR